MTYAGALTVSFHSEWHCGTGAGKHGGVDRTIALDDEGFPYVPGRTLKGLWRDACERVAHALDDGKDGGKPGEWTRLVRTLFGDPKLSVHGGTSSHSLVHVRDGRLTAPWRERLLGSEKDLLTPGLRVTRAGVAISEVTGTARPDYLRLIEFARGGLDVEASFTIAAPKHWAIDLVLSAGLAEVTALGAHRRRGAGRCRITTDALPAAAGIVTEHGSEVGAWRLDSLALRIPRPTPKSPPSPLAPAPLIRAGRVFLTLRQPVVVTRAVLGNLMLSHDFVPGATLLPMIAAALGPQASALIRAGQLVVTDAVPTPDTVRLARTPLSLVSGEKGSSWVTNHDDAHDTRRGVRDPADRPVSGWALRRTDGSWRVLRPGLTTTAHASIDDARQRTLENGVYTLQAIPVGSQLAFDVWLPEDQAGALSSLPKQAATGRYRQDSYGLVDVKVVTPPDDDAPSDLGADTEVSLWLTSDACIDRLPGIPDTTPGGFAKALEERLASHGVQTTLTVVEGTTFASISRRDSWSGSLSLPRTTLVGLAAGSVITLRTSAAIPGATLQLVLDQGLGERRMEGFGRCAVLPPARVRNVAPWTSDPTPPPAFDGTPAGEEPGQWADVRRAIWRTEIQHRIAAAATDQRVRESFLPQGATPSNLGTLRTAALALPRDTEAVDRWLAGTLEHDERGTTWSNVTDAINAHFGAAGLREPDTLHAWFGNHRAASAREVPPDLGGNEPPEVASWLLVECVRRQAQVAKTTGRES